MGRFRGVELADLVLTGPRLTLRRWQPGDADRVAAVMQDRSMHRFLALPDPYRPEDARAFVEVIGHEGRDDGTGLGSAVVERATGRVVGSAALRLAGEAGVGYWIAPDAQGRGHAAEATRLLAGWAFGLGVPRIELLCDVRNLASARTALAAGFGFEGIARDGLLTGGRPGIRDLRADVARFARLAGDDGAAVSPCFPWPDPDELVDEQILLRPVVPADADALSEADDALSRRWDLAATPRGAAHHRELADRAGLHWLVGPVARLAVVDRASGRTAGSLDLRTAGPPAVAGIGYVLHPDFRGRGWAGRALRLLAPWAFARAGIRRLELGAKADNLASIRSAERAGFEPDGVRRARLRNADGSMSDEVQFFLLAP